MDRVKKIMGKASLGIKRPKPESKLTIYERPERPEEKKEYYDKHIQKDATMDEYWMKMYRQAISYLPPVEENPAIMDLGCGPGYFAEVLYSDGYMNYLGVDFSTVCIEKAQERVPMLQFMPGDLYDKWIQEKFAEFDFFFALEVLEHLKRDKEVIGAIPSGKKVIISVPNNDGQGHVRIFGGVGEMQKWYEGFIEFEDVQTIYRGRGTVSFFMGYGTRS